ncbi:MAG: DUF116 domain-containing protein [Nanoarchaeota archaeon]|nr:DUF116 domain-containing protein [Nanoarchaeota archaeon]MBU1027547.1 DUF116 domain-containing protein [Nanoarchaeota archaeon]
MTKLLFLPYCLKKIQIQKLKKIAIEKNYEVYVVGGSSRVKKILQQYKNIEYLVGIACEDEIKLAQNYIQKLKNNGTKTKAILLTNDGCKGTCVNIEKVIAEL